MRDDLVWPKVLFREFSGRSCGAEVLRLHVRFLTNLKIGRRNPAVIRAFLVMLLRVLYVRLEIFVEISQVDSEFASTGGSHVVLWVNREVRVVAFVGEEWGSSGRFAGRVVVSEFGDRKEGGPVILLVVAIAT